MSRISRVAPLALATLAIAFLFATPRAEAQANVQRCSPSNTTHRVFLRLRGLTVSEQTCVIRFTSAGSVKAWVDTTWKRTSFRTKLRFYTVEARLELRNQPDTGATTRCRYVRDINHLRSGERTCETAIRVTQAHGWTGDGAVAFSTGHAHLRDLHGSPSV